MENDTDLREHLLSLLKGGSAHVDFEKTIKNLPVPLRGKRPKSAAHSPWEILEHLRIATWDILEFSRDASHVSPEWPSGYWPSTSAPPNAPPTGKAWNKSVNAFRAHMKAMADLVANPATDLFAKIPHGTGQTLLREALVLADHNAYHLGELLVVRRLLGAWK